MASQIKVDTITNAAGTGAPTLSNGIAGTTAGTFAGTGIVGEALTSQRLYGSPVSLTSNTTANILASPLALSAGDWLVFGSFGVTGTATSVTIFRSEISTVSATNNNPPAPYGGPGADGYNGAQWVLATLAGSTLALGVVQYGIPCIHVSVSTTTNLYLVGQATFSGGTCTAFGRLEAVRLR